MRKITATAVLVLTYTLVAQDQSSRKPAAVQAPSKEQPAPTSSAEPSKIAPAREADIRKLLELTRVAALMVQGMNGAEKSMRPLLERSFQPGEYRDRLIELFFAKFHSKVNTKALVDLVVPIYDKHLTGEDIRGLIAFYGTPLGQKMIEVQPQMLAEAQNVGRQWGEDLGRQSMQEVFAEHPDLAKAVEDANKSQQAK